MEQNLQALLGLLLIILISLALISAVVIIVLVELGWIVRLATRLYWRWRSSIHPPRVYAEEPNLAGHRQDTPRSDSHPVAQPNGTLPLDGAGGARRDSSDGNDKEV